MLKKFLLFNLFFILTFLFLSNQAQAEINHLLITEVQTGGAQSSQDFVKIYNPSQQPIDLSGMHLVKRTQSGKEYSLQHFPKGSQLPPKSYLTWANSKDNFASLIKASFQSQATLSANNSVALLDSQGNLIDAVAWGKGDHPFKEGNPFPQNPQAGQSLKRKQFHDYYLDSNSNQADFFLTDHRLTSSPQPDNLILGKQTPEKLSPEATLGLALGLGVISVTIIFLLRTKKL